MMFSRVMQLALICAVTCEDNPCLWEWFTNSRDIEFMIPVVNLSTSRGLSMSQRICMVSMGKHWSRIFSEGEEDRGMKDLDPLLMSSLNWRGTAKTRSSNSFNFDILDGIFLGFLDLVKWGEEADRHTPIHPECIKSKVCGFMTASGPRIKTCTGEFRGADRHGHCTNRATPYEATNVISVGVQHAQEANQVDEHEARYISEARKSVNPEICSIDGVEINQCDLASPGRWLMLHYASFRLQEGSLVYLSPGLNIKWSQINVPASDFYCINVSDHLNTHYRPCEVNCTDNCQGDELYCSVHQCARSAECKCSFIGSRGMAEVQIGDRWFKPAVVGSQQFFVKEDVPVLQQPSADCTTCSMTCTAEGIAISSIKDELKDVTVCVEGFCSTRVSKGSKVWKIEFHNQYPSSGSVALARGTTVSGETFELTAECGRRTGCEQINCLFCREMLSNPQCYPYGKWFLLFLILATLYITIALLKTIMRIFMACLSILYGPFIIIIKISRCLGRLGKRKGERTYVRLMEALDDEKKPEVVRSPASLGKTKQPRIVLFIVLALLVHMALCCDESRLVEETSVTCNPGPDNIFSCSTKEMITVKELRAGKTICVSLKGPGGSLSSPIKIKMLDIVGRSDLLDIYFTFNGHANCKSVRRCRWAGSCGNSGCIGVGKEDYDRELGDQESSLHPNWRDCYDGCGGAACGCFNAAPSCIFLKRYITNADTRVFKVFKPSAWFLSTKIVVETTSHKEDITLKSGEAKVIDKVSFHYRTDKNLFAGMSVPPIVTEVKREGKPLSFFLENQGQHPKCKDENSARTSSASNCIIDQNTISANVRVDDVSCRSNLVSISGMSTLKPLPQRVGDFLIQLHNDEPVLLATGDSGVVEGELQIDLSHKKISIKVDTTVCRGTVKELKGCVGCTKGAFASLEIHSTSAGSASLQCSLSSCYMEVQKGVNNVNCSLRFSKAVVEETCVLACSGSKEQLSIKGNLIIGGDFKKLTEDSATSFSHTDSKDTRIHLQTGLMNWLDTLFGASLLGKILGIGLAILSPFILILILRWILKIALRRSRIRREPKYEMIKYN
ncbi:glycoprotein precursor [Forecariah virus]|uniref:Envelopment polyprotein n=1 Tax=Forecariah virus TaxID=1282797 RepID=L7V0S6_9VIRU|nr:glycoprotein precursor [Forecariah virus]